MKKGYIITEKPGVVNGVNYCGVDNSAFPLDFSDCLLFSGLEIEQLQDLVLYNVNTPFLLNAEQAERYIQECINNGLEYRCLYCEVLSEREAQEHELPLFYENKEFLGFDYAYGAGDYYSCILNDIICRPALLSYQHILNTNGLIDTLSTLNEFIKKRTEVMIMNETDPDLFEVGDFYIYCVYLCN